MLVQSAIEHVLLFSRYSGRCLLACDLPSITGSQLVCRMRILMCELVSVCMLGLAVHTVVSVDTLTASMFENLHDPWVPNPKRWVDAKNNDVLDAGQPLSRGDDLL